jgi:hypothetical protein
MVGCAPSTIAAPSEPSFLASRWVRFGAVFRRVSLTVLEGLRSPRKASHDSEGLAGESDASPLTGVRTGERAGWG